MTGSPTSDEREAEWTPPDEFDEYRLVRLLGGGSMGQVFLAHDRLLDRAVAIKFLTSVTSENARERFVIEARAAARIQHPNVMGIYRVGELDEHPYLVTEYIRGKSLSELDMPMPWQEVLELAIGLARGLATAHRQGVLHRDIKLANAILSEETNEVKLVDFSLAKLEVDAEAIISEGEAKSRERQKAKVPIERLSDRPDPRNPVTSSHKSLAALAKKNEFDATISVDEFQREDTVDRALPQEPEAASQSGGGLHRSALLESAAKLEGDWRHGPSALTQSGSLVGTPHYMAPELWNTEPASRESDIYAMGVLLYILCVGKPPFAALSPFELAMLVREQDIPKVRAKASMVDGRFAAIIEKCMAREPAERFRSGDALRNELENLLETDRQPSSFIGNPYRGLRAFQAEHRNLFFGRTSEIRMLLDRLRSESFVLVAGDSGVGKSSLVRAGVAPRLADGAIEPERTWTYANMIPGRHPLKALTSLLVSHFELNEDTLLPLVESKPDTLGWLIHKKLGPSKGKLLFIDQFEELVTIADKEEARITGKILAQFAAGIPGVRLMATVRGDFLTRAATVPHIGPELSRAIYLLTPLAPDGIREAIVGPAETQNVTYESEALIEELVNNGIEGSLPILQFALAELWEVRNKEESVIKGGDLREIGGVTGALARHADGLIGKLPLAQQKAARKLLMRLVTIDDTRASLRERDLVGDKDDNRHALEALVKGRLLVIRETDQGSVHEIAHEALINGWGTLRRWLDEEKEVRSIRHRLELQASEWERLKRPRSALWAAEQIEEAKVLVRAELRPREVVFLEASEGAVARRKLFVRALAVTVPLALAGAYGYIRYQAYQQLQAQVAEHISVADSALMKARSHASEFETARGEALLDFDRYRYENAEKRWKEALQIASRGEVAYREAARSLENAFSLDASRVDVRASIADVIYERALLAEQTYNNSRIEELIERLGVYDDDGSRMGRWTAPATLGVTTKPPGAVVWIERFSQGDDGVRTPSPRETLGTTPLRGQQLELGSYRLTVERDGYYPVIYPLRPLRGERVELSIALPRPSDIPEGYIYIPTGRSLFGSVNEDLRSTFFVTAPLHNVTTRAYVIQRHEVTTAEYIEFLEDLPPAERERLTPKIDNGVAPFLIERGEDGVWMFEMKRADTVIRARAGETVIYPGRVEPVAQDWLQFPIGGMGFDYSKPYLAWLDRTGRLPGARFCTDYEWERAARGADERLYPHGDILDPKHANIDTTYTHDPTSWGFDRVGSFPVTRSVFGVDNMVGNAGELVTSSLVQGEVIVRAGAYQFEVLSGQSRNRTIVPPTYRDAQLGIRVCASYPLVAHPETPGTTHDEPGVERGEGAPADGTADE